MPVRSVRSAFILVLLVLVRSSVALSDEPAYRYGLLKDWRSRITLPEYTLDEKRQVLRQVRIMYEGAYSHRFLKIERFGAAVDPLPKLAALEPRLDGMSTHDLSVALRDIELPLRDLHTAYYWSDPHTCYWTALSIRIERIWKEGRVRLVVGQKKTTPEIAALDPQGGEIAPGDEIVEYDGKSPVEAIRAAGRTIDYGNASSKLSYSVQALSMLGTDRRDPPAEDAVKIVFRSAKGGLYSRTLPWIAMGNTACIKKTETPGLPSSPANAFVDASESSIAYKTVKNKQGLTAGVIRIKDFFPVKSESYEPKNYMKVFQDLFAGPLASTDFLIFDVRNNRGGYSDLAVLIPQLFSEKTPKPIRKRVLVTPLGKQIAEYDRDSSDKLGLGVDFAKSVLDAAARGERYGDWTPYETDEHLSVALHAYSKPVVVLTNGSCVSACETLAAVMKDNGVARIVGEDRSTAGGGASLMSHYVFDDQYLGPTGHSPLTRYRLEGDITMSWLQLGRSNGALIENDGVKSDLVLRPHALDDLLGGDGMYYRIERPVGLAKIR